MKRGVINLSKREFSILNYCLDKQYLKGPVIDRLNVQVPENTQNIELFLSEEDAESILDSFSFERVKESEEYKGVRNKVREFLTEMRGS